MRDRQLVRIALVNPNLVATLADYVSDPDRFDAILSDLAGLGQEIGHWVNVGLSEVMASLPYRLIDQVRYRASRDTSIYWLTDGENHYRLWWWCHADGGRDGRQMEGFLFRESPERIAVEMAYYD